MNEDQRKKLAMDAKMEGQEVIVSNLGKKIKVSEMELICLVNFAEVGLMSLWSSLDGPTGELAEKDLDRTLNAIRKHFGRDGNDGLTRLATSAAAMLRGGKFSKYLAS